MRSFTENFHLDFIHNRLLLADPHFPNNSQFITFLRAGVIEAAR